MITTNNLTKSFDKTEVLKGVDITLPRGSVMGLVGTNGVGKSTLLRIMCGVLKADGGTVTVDGEHVYDNPSAKSKLAFVSDDPYFISGASLVRMASFYESLFPRFDKTELFKLADNLSISTKTAVDKMSKGQRRQCAIILALATRPDCLILDETFDGLDPAAKNAVRLLIFERAEQGMAALMSTHSLRELEDTCDRLAMLKNGKISLDCDINDIKSVYLKVQTAFDTPIDINAVFDPFEVVSVSNSGKLYEITVKGDKQSVFNAVKPYSPIIFESVPLSLEEIFLYEAKDYEA